MGGTEGEVSCPVSVFTMGEGGVGEEGGEGRWRAGGGSRERGTESTL
jgi:hypothetical protein